jgi:FACT complex subunit SSRP1/POB3
MFPTFLRLRGKTYDYKVTYEQVVKLFLLPKPDDAHVLFVVGVDPPLRQGQTRYGFLVVQFTREEDMEVEINLEEYPPLCGAGRLMVVMCIRRSMPRG